MGKAILTHSYSLANIELRVPTTEDTVHQLLRRRAGRISADNR
jgi:hypothetical protein